MCFMKQSYCILSFIFYLITLPTCLVYAQNEVPDNKGKEFWLMFNRNNDNKEINMELFITGDVESTGQVILPDASYLDFLVTPGAVTTVNIPSTFIATLADGIDNKGIHVIAENEITVYGLNHKPFSTDAFLGLPVDVSGKEYLVMSNSTYSPNSSTSSVFGVVATMDNTEVTIVPSSNTKNRTAGVPYQITLQKGETYQLAADVFFADLTGSIITSNNPISVFSGHTCGNEPLFTDGCDHMIEQIPPVTTLGKSFVTVPLATRRAGDVFRIVATEDDTNVSVNGNNGYAEIFSLDKGEFKILNVPSNVYSKIESNHAILVAQLSKGQRSDNVPSDPFLMLVPPIEQFQNHYKVSTPVTGFDKHFINLAVPIYQKDKIELDGSFLDPSIFTDIPGSAHAGAQVEVDEGMHNITGELPFVAFMYGFGSFESYGYPGGHSLASVEQVRSINLDLVEEAQQGITYCFNATVKDDNEIPIFGVRVDFEVQGPNEKIGFAVTNEQGIANFCFDAIRPGTNKIIATVGSTETATIIETEKTPVPTTITFLEYVVQGIVGEEICLGATILDQFGMPLGGEEVSFDVNGLFYSTAITDEDGRIVFCQTPDDMGDLIVTAYFEGGESTEATIIAGYVSEDLKIESFWWVDASTNTIISEIKAGDKIPYSTIKDKKLTIVVTSDPEIVGSVKMEMEYLTSCPTCAIENYTITENIIPYSLYGDVKGRYVGYGFSPGSYALTATPYETRYHTGNQGLKATINFEVLFDSSIDGFTLINATNDTDIREIMDGDIIDLSSFKGKKFNVRANVPLNQQQGGVGMEISGPVNFSQFEKLEPMALFMDTNGDYAGKELPEGNYALSATAFPFNSSTNRGMGGETVTINFEVMILGSKVDKLTLVNADTDKDIMTIMEGTYIDLNQYKDVKLNIRADGKGDDIAAMTFQLSGAKNYNWTERKAPYAIFGDLPAEDYNGKYFKEGNYKLMVTPYNSDNVMGERLTVNFVAGFNLRDNLRVNSEALNQLESMSSEREANAESLEEDLKVYPQPAQNFVNIVYPSFIREDAMVMIYKGNGQLIHGAQMGNTANFNFGSYGSGLYLIHVTNGERIISKKVFIY